MLELLKFLIENPHVKFIVIPDDLQPAIFIQLQNTKDKSGSTIAIQNSELIEHYGVGLFRHEVERLLQQFIHHQESMK